MARAGTSSSEKAPACSLQSKKQTIKPSKKRKNRAKDERGRHEGIGGVQAGSGPGKENHKKTDLLSFDGGGGLRGVCAEQGLLADGCLEV